MKGMKNLALLFRFQGLGTGGLPDLTRHNFPAIYIQLTKASRVASTSTILYTITYTYITKKSSFPLYIKLHIQKDPYTILKGIEIY